MQAREVIVPPVLLAEWWGLGPYGKTWDGVEIRGHSGTTNVGSSYLLWALDKDVAVATTVNAPRFGYPFAARVFQRVFPEVAGIRVPGGPERPSDVSFDSSRLVGTYAMSGVTFTIAGENGTLTIASDNELEPGDSVPPSPLVPLTPTTFLPTHPGIDGRRGWALAFVGAEDGPATHLLNGVFAMRRLA
jgi:hypothetical protein